MTPWGWLYADTGSPLTKVATVAAAGQYSVSNGVYSLSSSETDLNVLASYTYTSALSGTKLVIANPQLGINPVFQVVFNLPFTTATGLVNFLAKFNYCVASKLAIASKLDDFTIPEFDFSAGADAQGNLMTLSFA